MSKINDSLGPLWRV